MLNSETGTYVAALCGCLHIGFFVFEAFFWTSPLARKVFRHTPEFAEASRKLAANMGLYNGFLAAGLFWGTYLTSTGDPNGIAVQVFFLSCVAIAGIVGALTVKFTILIAQTVPAGFGLVCHFFGTAAPALPAV